MRRHFRLFPIVLLAALLPLATRASAQAFNIDVCVLDSGALKEVEALYNPTTGDTTVSGKPFSSVFPPTAGYAASASWYINNDPIELLTKSYVKYGLPRILGVNEISRSGEFDGVPVFAEVGTRGTPEVVYVPVRSGCEFQPYQQEVMDLADVIVPPTPIEITDVVTGFLDEDDSWSEYDGYHEDYVFDGRAGQTVVMEMRSTEIDTYLSFGWVEDGDFWEIESNDDGLGDSTDSRIAVELPETREYIIRASSYTGEEEGFFTLSLQAEGAVPVSRGTGAIALGETVSGRLDSSDPVQSDNSHYEDYVFVARAGQRVVITMRSNDFDTYLYVGTGTGESFSSLDSNDDGLGTGTDSRLEISFADAGEYVIRANSWEGGETGAYTISINTQ